MRETEKSRDKSDELRAENETEQSATEQKLSTLHSQFSTPKRVIVIEPYGYNFLRATMYRKGLLWRRVEQRTHMHEAYVDQLNQTVEYWRQAKEMQKSQIIHRGFGKKHSIFTEAYFYLRGWYFHKILAAQVRQANALCRLTRKKVYVMTNTRGFPRIIQSRQIPMLKKQGVIKKDATALDFDRECLYKIEYKQLINNN